MSEHIITPYYSVFKQGEENIIDKKITYINKVYFFQLNGILPASKPSLIMEIFL